MIGIDEVGRGCWAGPLLVVAAQLTGDLPEGLTDSKLLTRQQREAIYKELISNFQFGEGWVSANEIDKDGLANALKLGVSRSLKKIAAKNSDEIIFDGKVNYIESKFKNSKCIINADMKIPVVSAASIYAKVTRDKFMTELSLNYPAYGFEKHVGYGTNSHKMAIDIHGIIEGIHRTSYKPVKILISS
jgi:ribonuclease HII